ncbi:MAG: DUF421 domain-containing protein [Candidatus Viridilinea halotolerans]|uniref:DUF421 domain-containing protein n=1 Tax=Candidatus Viridilinea halotolerans TaxID=2491704 RepID=A0A426UAU9_9CHLR|nr:MAG: DUF421 domain-containing protein [Candidatus Viridilinea halotolerans]
MKSDPVLLAYNGRILPDALRRERVVEQEVWAAARSNGIADLAEIEAVVLETDGTFNVIPKLAHPDKPTLQSVKGYEEQRSASSLR